MSKLHELLAVERSQSEQGNTCRTQLAETFTKKAHHFSETTKTFTADGENARAITEEQKSLQAKVPDELSWITGILTKVLDLGYQIDLGNLTAKADIVTEDGETLVKDVPTTGLLRLEHRVTEFILLLKQVPTLDPAKGFEPDSARGLGVYKAREITKRRTKKDKKIITKAPATDKHPAQVEVYDADIEIGTILEQEWSGMTTPAIKSDLIARAEIVLRAVKRARSRANEVEVDVAGKKIGKTLFEFILQPVKAA